MSASTAHSPSSGEAAQTGAGIPRAMVLLLATVCGAAAANIYYAQPLLDTLRHDFSVSTSTSGLIVTIAQIGYVLGLVILVPLGDLVERRALITSMMLVTAAAMAVCALAPGFGVFAAATAVAGLSAVVAQVIVPMTSTMARPQERGQVVGTVMSGLLIGILLARTLSGLIASALGWRVVFWFAAAVMVTLALALRRALPRVAPTTTLRYGAVLGSVVELVRAEPVLRRRMALGCLTFGCFTTLWTSLSFLLSAAPFHYGNAVIGLFGLAGVAGAGAASATGRLADRGHGEAVTAGAAVLMAISFAVLYLGRHSAVGLIAGIIVLDLGVQALHISNQHAIYALAPEARSRLTTAYMVSYFSGGVILSALSSAVYATDGWGGICALGAATGLLAILVWAIGARRAGMAG